MVSYENLFYFSAGLDVILLILVAVVWFSGQGKYDDSKRWQNEYHLKVAKVQELDKSLSRSEEKADTCRQEVLRLQRIVKQTQLLCAEAVQPGPSPPQSAKP